MGDTSDTIFRTWTKVRSERIPDMRGTDKRGLTVFVCLVFISFASVVCYFTILKQLSVFTWTAQFYACRVSSRWFFWRQSERCAFPITFGNYCLYLVWKRHAQLNEEVWILIRKYGTYGSHYTCSFLYFCCWNVQIFYYVSHKRTRFRLNFDGS